MGRTGQPAARVLRLAAYLAAHPTEDLTLSRIGADVPGYPETPRDEHGDVATGGPGWETLRKALRRDREDLRERFGIVVDYDTADHVWRLRPPFFTPEQRRALVAAAAVVDVEGLDDELDAGELGTAVAEHSRRVVLQVHRRVLDFIEARRTRTPVTFRYRDRTRVFDPYAIGGWRNRWYVVGRDHEADELRRFRLDRIDDADVGTSDADRGVIRAAGDPGSYDVPDDFDAASALALDPNDWGRDPHVVAEIRVDADHLQALRRDLGGRVVRRDDGHAVVAVDVRHRDSFRVRLTALGMHARLVGPPALVADLRDWLARIAEEA